MLRFVMTVSIAALCASGPGHAQALAETSRAQIVAAVVQALGGSVREQDVALAVDTRLTRCDLPLQATATNARTVEVRCAGQPGWKLYVPVRVEQVQPVVVAARQLRPGVAVTAEQLTIQARDMAAVDGNGYASVEEVAGRIPRRGLPAGAVVREADMAAELGVSRGQIVQLQSGAGGIRVTAEGRAVASAAVGAQVAVENLSSRRIVRGRVIEPGVVQTGQQL